MKTRIVQKLRDSELRYRRLFEAAQDGILILDAETGMIEDVNPYLIKMLGYSREEFVEKKLWEVGAFKDIEASKDAFEVLQENEYIRYEDLPLRAKDGRLIQVEFVSNVYLAGDENIIQCDIRDITEHKRIITALQGNEKRYHDLIDQSPDGYFVIELSGNILTVNKAMCKELEFSEEEFLSLNIWDIIPGQYLDEYRKKLTKVLQGESLKEATEYIVHGKDGKAHYVEVLSAPRYSGRNIIGFQGIARDITARKQAEEALQESEARNRELIKHLPTVVYMNAVGDASSTLYVSPQIQTLVGYTPQEWMADPKLWSKTLHPEDSQQVLAQAALTDQTNKPFEMEYRMIARDGRLVWVHDEIILVKDSDGQPQFWQGIMLDITERKEAEDALYESREQFSNAFQYSAIGMALVSLEGRWLKVNPMLCSITGYSEAELLTKAFQDITHADDLNMDLDSHNQLLTGEIKAYKMEKRYRHKDGRFVWVFLAVSLARDNAGEPLHFISQVEDITERKVAEESLRKSESLLRATGKMARVGGWEFDVATTKLVWTEEVNEIHEVGRDFEPTINKWINLFASEATPVFAHAMERAATHAEPFDLQLPIITQQGNRRWVHTLGQVQQSNGKTTHVSGTLQDITERKLGEEALRESESSLQGILRSTADGILAVSKENKTLFTNDRFIEMWRIPPAVLASQDDSVILQHVLDQLSEPQAFLKKVQDLYKSDAESFDTLYFKDGRVFERLSRPLLSNRISHPLLQAAKLRGRVWSFRDISERKQAEEKIQQQLEHLTALRTIDRVIAANFDLKLSLSEILTHVTKELGVDAAAILILNSNSQMLEYGAERGFRTKAVKKLPVSLSRSYAGRVVLKRESVQIQSPKDEPENLFLGTPLAGEDFVFYYGVPLIIKGQVKGVLEVFQRAVQEPHTEWSDFLHNLASQAAIAIENAMLFESLQRSNSELMLAYDATIEGWSRALDLRDKETEGHTQRVTAMTEKLARTFGLHDTELMQIRWGALLHDIGKMGVPDGILLKPGALTDEEWVAMKKHPAFAYEMISPIRYLQQSLDIPYCHHEKWDGTGYPRGLKGDQIPLSARIFAVVDVWDALCSDRPYRAGWPEEKVREHIRSLSGTHFDPQVVDVFMQSLN